MVVAVKQESGMSCSWKINLKTGNFIAFFTIYQFIQRMKTIIITGASRGIGAATAILAAQKGYSVCVNYFQNEAAAMQIVHTIEENGGAAMAFKADISSEAAVLQMFDFVEEEWGYVDALVNNAGILEQQMEFWQMDATRMERILAVNVMGSFLCAREAVKRMSPKRGGKGGAIVNVSSIASRLGSPFEYVDYAASKGAIDTLTIGLGKEVAEQGIRVNAVRPGLIDTDIHASGGKPNRVEEFKHHIPMKRGGSPLEVAHSILWLLSDEAAYITATILDVGGGR
ncbi:MAG: SDR family oxidoreductase [Chitinophagales bacterium]